MPPTVMVAVNGTSIDCPVARSTPSSTRRRDVDRCGGVDGVCDGAGRGRRTAVGPRQVHHRVGGRAEPVVDCGRVGDELLRQVGQVRLVEHQSTGRRVGGASVQADAVLSGPVVSQRPLAGSSPMARCLIQAAAMWGPTVVASGACCAVSGPLPRWRIHAGPPSRVEMPTTAPNRGHHHASWGGVRPGAAGGPGGWGTHAVGVRPDDLDGWPHHLTASGTTGLRGVRPRTIG